MIVRFSDSVLFVICKYSSQQRLFSPGVFPVIRVDGPFELSLGSRGTTISITFHCQHELFWLREHQL